MGQRRPHPYPTCATRVFRDTCGGKQIRRPRVRHAGNPPANRAREQHRRPAPQSQRGALWPGHVRRRSWLGVAWRVSRRPRLRDGRQQDPGG